MVARLRSTSIVMRSYPACISLLRQSLDRPSSNLECLSVDSAYRVVRPRSDPVGASRHGRDGFRHAVP